MDKLYEIKKQHERVKNLSVYDGRRLISGKDVDWLIAEVELLRDVIAKHNVRKYNGN